MFRALALHPRATMAIGVLWKQLIVAGLGVDAYFNSYFGSTGQPHFDALDAQNAQAVVSDNPWQLPRA